MYKDAHTDTLYATKNEIVALLATATKDSSRPTLRGIAVSVAGHALASTDGHALVVVTHAAGPVPGYDAAWQLIPRDAWERAAKLLRKGQLLAITVSDGMFVLDAAGTRIEGALPYPNFPPVYQVIPHHEGRGNHEAAPCVSLDLCMLAAKVGPLGKALGRKLASAAVYVPEDALDPVLVVADGEDECKWRLVVMPVHL
jgi:hypothetical protein